jgi:hypothetical protein
VFAPRGGSGAGVLLPRSAHPWYGVGYHCRFRSEWAEEVGSPPQYTRLAMGSAHAAYIVMQINLRAIGLALSASSALPPFGIPDSPDVGWLLFASVAACALSESLVRLSPFEFTSSFIQRIAELRRLTDRVLVAVTIVPPALHCRGGFAETLRSRADDDEVPLLACSLSSEALDDVAVFHYPNVAARNAWIDLLVIDRPPCSPCGPAADPRAALLERML